MAPALKRLAIRSRALGSSKPIKNIFHASILIRSTIKLTLWKQIQISQYQLVADFTAIYDVEVEVYLTCQYISCALFISATVSYVQIMGYTPYCEAPPRGSGEWSPIAVIPWNNEVIIMNTQVSVR